MDGNAATKGSIVPAASETITASNGLLDYLAEQVAADRQAMIDRLEADQRAA